MQAVYIITQKTFFERPHGGAVSHAMGILEGLKDNGYETKVLWIKGSSKNQVPEEISNCILMMKSMSDIISHLQQTKPDFVLIRKNATNLFKLHHLQKNLDCGKLCVEVNGLSMQALQANKFAKHIYRLVRFIHYQRLKNIQTIYVVNRQILHDLKQNQATSNIIHIENGMPKFDNINKKGQSKKILFFGRFQSYNDYLLFQQIQPFCEVNNIHIELVGSGPEFEKTQELLKDYSNITFHGFKKRKDFLEGGYLSNNTVGIIPMKDCTDSKYLSPIKLYEYLAMKIPVVYSNSLNVNVKNMENVVFKYDNSSAESCQAAVYQALKVSAGISDETWNKVAHTNGWNERMKSLVSFHNRD